MATFNLIQMKRSATPGKVPTTQDLSLGEFGINTYDGKVFIKKDDGAPSIIEVGVRGATAVQNVFYVSKSGNDANDGKSLDKSKLTIKSAVEAARGLNAKGSATIDPSDGSIADLYVTNPGAGYELPLIPSVTIFGDGVGAEAAAIISNGSVVGFTILDPGSGYSYADVYIEPPGAGRTGAGATIFVKSGDYTEDNPIFVPAGVCIVGDSLRAVTVRPQNTTLDLFWVNNKSYFTEMTFRDHKAPAAIFSFPSVDITGIENTVPARVTFSGVFGYNRVKCSRDIGLIVDALAQDLKFSSTNGNSQSVFAGLQYWSQTGYSIANNEVTPTLGALGQLKTEISSLILSTVAVATDNLLDVIINILNGTTNPATVTDDIIPNGMTAATGSIATAYSTIQSSRTTIINNVIDWIDAQILASVPGYVGLTFNHVTCARDLGYIIDSMCYDLLYGGNRQVIQSGIYYLGFSTTDTAIPGEIPQVTAAYRYLKTIIPSIITGTPLATVYQTVETQVTSGGNGTSTQYNAVNANIDQIIDIIVGGPAVAPVQEPIGLTPSGVSNVLNAYNKLMANRDFIRAEVIAYIDRETISFDRAKCYRDVGLIVDALAQDVYFTGATQSTFAGIQYWSQNSLTTSSELGAGERLATIATFGFIRDLVKDVVQNITSGGSVVHYAPGTYTQDTSNPAATATEANLLADNFDLIISILNADTTDGVTDQIVPNSITAAGGNKAQAVANIVANYDYIKEQAAKYIQATYPAVYATYDAVKCARDVGYILDSVTVDLLYGGNRQSIQSAVYYYTYNATSFVPTEIQQIEKAYGYIKILSSYIIRGLPMPYVYQEGEPQVFATNPGTLTQVTEVQNKVNLILDIINDYTTTNPLFEKGPLPTTPSATAARLYSAQQLLANREFIKAEVVAYLDGYTYNRTTCARDSGLIVDAIVQDLLFDGDSQSTFAAIQYWSQTAQIIPSNEAVATADVLDYIITQTDALLTPIRPTDATNVSNGLGLIRDLINGTVAVATITSGIVPNSIDEDVTAQSAFDALQAEKAIIINDAIAYIAANYPSLTYNEATCRRDLGYIIDSVSFDLLYNADPTNVMQSNRQAVQSGVYYWNHIATSIVPGEKALVTAAYDYIKTLASYIVEGRAVPNTYGIVSQVFPVLDNDIGTRQDVIAISDKLDLMINIINGGPDVAPPAQPIKLTKIGSFTYDSVKCSRDIGLIVDALAQDLKFPGISGNSQSVFAGLQYWAQDGYSIPNGSPSEVTATLDALAYLRSAVAALPSVTVDTTTNALFNTIINILNGGTPPNTVTDLIVPNGTTASVVTAVTNAYTGIQAAKATLTASTISYIQGIYGTFFDQATCERDIGYILDSVCYDLLYGGNRQVIQSGIYYLNFSSTVSAIPNETPQVTAAYRYLKTLIPNIISGTPLSSYYQTTEPQVTIGDSGFGAEDAIMANIDTILDIILNGPTPYEAVGVRTPIGLTAVTDTTLLAAYDKLVANRDFLRAEVIAYINFVTVTRYQNTINAAQLLHDNRSFIVSELIGFVDDNFGSSHPYEDGDTVSIRYVTGMTEVNNEYVIEISALTNTNPVRMSFTKGHTFGDRASMRVYGVLGMTELNGNRYYAKYVNGTEVDLYYDVNLTSPVDGTNFNAYTSGGLLETDCFYYVRKIDNDSIDLYLDRALTQPVDATSWGTYISGGIAGTGSLPVSPYVHNCSSITTTGTGMRVDGNLSTGLRSMVLDSYTQINEGGNGIEIINRGYAQLVSIYTICTDKGVYAKKGGICSIENSNCSFGNYALYADGLSDILYSGLGDGIGQTGKTIRVKGMSKRPNYDDAMDIESNITISGAKIRAASASVDGAGTGYFANEEITLSGGTLGVGGAATKFKITTVKVVGQSNIVSGTRAYNNGDVLTFSAGFSTAAVIEVTAFGGNITGITVINPGVKNTPGNVGLNPEFVNGVEVTNAASGADTFITFVYGVNSVAPLINSTEYYTVAPTGSGTNGNQVVGIGTTGGSGTGATLSVYFTVRLEFATPHYFIGGENITISNVGGMTQLNGNNYYIKLVGISTKADIYSDQALALGVDTTGFGTYTSGGTANLHDYYTVYSSSEPVQDTSTGLLTSIIDLQVSIKRPIADNAVINFRQRSRIQSSGHGFEFIGSGIVLANATPAAGGYPIAGNEVFEINGGKVYFTGTTEQGDFKIGTELTINRNTGTISGRTFDKSLFAVLTPYILALEG